MMVSNVNSYPNFIIFNYYEYNNLLSQVMLIYIVSKLNSNYKSMKHNKFEHEYIRVSYMIVSLVSNLVRIM